MPLRPDFFYYMFYRRKLSGCNIGILNKIKIQIYILKMRTVLKGIYNSLEVVDKADVRAV